MLSINSEQPQLFFVQYFPQCNTFNTSPINSNNFQLFLLENFLQNIIFNISSISIVPFLKFTPLALYLILNMLSINSEQPRLFFLQNFLQCNTFNTSSINSNNLSCFFLKIFFSAIQLTYHQLILTISAVSSLKFSSSAHFTFLCITN